jgi:membrane protease YdiL (CAAX protease family)
VTSPLESQAPPPAPSSDDGFAAALRGLGPAGILAIVVIALSGTIAPGGVSIPLGALLVLAWARMSRTPWREIGYVRPQSRVASVVIGIVLGVAFKLVMKAVVMPLLGADPINRPYHYLAGNRSALPSAAWAMLMAGFGEETVFRGFFFERLRRLFGSGTGARVAVVLVTSALFSAAHVPNQGLAGAEQAAVTGLVFGTIFAVTGEIWLPMCAHAAFDLTALAIIYWDLESKVARLIFR